MKSQLADRIRQGLEQCGPRAEVAAAMGYRDASSLSRWANGGTVPTAENLAALGIVTGLSVDWLVTGRGSMFAAGVSEGSSEALRLDAIRRIAAGDVPDETLRVILARPTPP